MEGGEADHDLVLVEVVLQAEAAADVGGDHPDAVLGQAGDLGDAVAHGVGGLAGGPDREAAVGVGGGDDAPRLHRGAHHPADVEAERERLARRRRTRRRCARRCRRRRSGTSRCRRGRRRAAVRPVRARPGRRPPRGARRPRPGCGRRRPRPGSGRRPPRCRRARRRSAPGRRRPAGRAGTRPACATPPAGGPGPSPGARSGRAPPRPGTSTSVVSRPRSVPWATGDRTMAACRRPGQLDVVGEAAPTGEQPRVLEAGEALADPGHAPDLRARVGGLECGPGVDDGGPDVDVAGAAAEMAAEDLVDGVVDGDAVVGGGHQRHHDARGAEPALEAVVGAQCLLHGVQRARRGDALDRGHLGAVGLHRQHQARPHRPPVEHHRAGAARALLAGDVGAGEPGPVAQGVGEEGAPLDGEGAIGAVDADGDGSGGVGVLGHGVQLCFGRGRVGVGGRVRG